MNNRQTGSRYEKIAAEYLKKRGLEVLEMNFRCRSGEIDLICRDGAALVFVEVKYRKNASMGEPAEAVGYIKQQRIRNTAVYYLYSRRYGEPISCRFDIVSILGTQIRWIKDAFDF